MLRRRIVGTGLAWRQTAAAYGLLTIAAQNIFESEGVQLVNALWGTQAPIYYGMTEEGRFVSREEHFGRPVLLLLVGRDALPLLPGLFAQLGAVLPALARGGVGVFLVLDQDPRAVRLQTGSCPVPAIDCGRFLQRCGVGAAEVMALLLDRGQRVVLQAFPLGDPQFGQVCLDLVAAQRPLPAPVLVRPHIFSAEWCRELIDLFERSPSMEGEVARVDASGRACSVVDHSKKRRRDMAIAEGTGLHETLVGRLFSLCRPEIARAFQVDVTHVDRVLIARYDASGGWFRRHRDNTNQQVAFREFALSVNLNTGEYEGGQLSFPEYNDELYEPPAGGGLIFSASMLHEVTPIRAGRRYVLLTFMHSDAAEARRISAVREVEAAGLGPAPGRGQSSPAPLDPTVAIC
jgi:predicted 2-oxoglutarate/Fe(II)-dependent dioxygenase YbiX